jgi:hypothetical protein
MSHPSRSLAFESNIVQKPEPVAEKKRKSVFAAFAVLFSRNRLARNNY